MRWPPCAAKASRSGTLGRASGAANGPRGATWAGCWPQLHLPQASPALVTDPRAFRDRLVSEFIDVLYADRQLRSLTVTWHRVDNSTTRAEYGGPPSILFLSEAERLLRERLDSIGLLALRLLARDRWSKLRFMREVVGSLYWDYVGWHQFAQNFPGDECATGEDWRPPRERPPAEEIDEDELNQLGSGA